MHIGKESVLCPDLKIHGYNMEKVSSDKYLGDILSSDGRNSINMKERIGKGIGIISEIMSIMDTISFGFKYFRMLILLREAMFCSSTGFSRTPKFGMELRIQNGMNWKIWTGFC